MFKKLRGKLKGDDGSSSHMSLGTDQHQQYASNTYHNDAQDQKRPTEKYEAPQGPPPNHASSSGSIYAPPSGPPPSHNVGSSNYAPPPGPPPNFPSQPPPSWDPPPYHDWTVIPDTALLPPPPSIGYDTSPTANASVSDSDRALAWTRANPLWPPQHLTPTTHSAIQNGQLALLKPPTYIGDLLPQPHAGHWRCRTHASCRDASILTNLPLYSATTDSPLTTSTNKTIYFEVQITSLGRNKSISPSFKEAEAGLAIGFIAPPYPTFRLPGWERASLGVHGDDGRKYVNDPWGGVDFTSSFLSGQRVGIGIVFSIPTHPPAYDQEHAASILDVHVFFTRDGVKVGGWDGNEELDVRSEGGSVGLRGERDLFAAIGVFGAVDFDVFFHPAQCLYRP